MATPPTIRPRHPTDLDDCVTVLRAVYAKDQYPRAPNINYHDFLNSPDIPFAWVAERSVADVNECGGGSEEDEIIGHVAIGKASESDLSVKVWRAKHRGDGGVVTATFGRAAAEAAASDQVESQNEQQHSSQPSERQQHQQQQREDAGENIAILERLFVHPLSRKSGAAANLVNAAVEFAQRAGQAEQEKLDLSPSAAATSESGSEEQKRGIRLVLFVLDANVAAMRLYERLGWEDYGRGVFQWGPSEEEKMGATCFASPLKSS